MATHPKSLAVEKVGRVAFIRHRGRGFLSAALLGELRHHLARLERDPDIGVIVFETRGGLLHMEIDELVAMISETPRALGAVAAPVALALRSVLSPLRRIPPLARLLLDGRPRALRASTAFLDALFLFDAVDRSSKITVFVCEGPCVGGALELALCFDYRLVGADEAGVIGLPEARIAMMPGFGGTQRLARLLGTARARQFLLEGALVTPDAALRLGLVDAVYIPADREPVVDDFIDRLARRAPAASRAIKRTMRATEPSVWPGLFAELRELMPLVASRDTRARLDAYAEALGRALELPEAEQPSLAEVADAIDRGVPPTTSQK